MQDKRDAQLNYELESDAEAQAAKLRKLIAESKEGKLELPRTQALIGRMSEIVASEIEATAKAVTRGKAAKYKNWIRALPHDVAAVIAIRECIRLCTSPNTAVLVQDLAYAVGKVWELEVRIRQAEKVNPLYMQRVHEQVQRHGSRDYGHLRRLYNVAVDRVFKGTIDLDITTGDMIHIGKFGVDACYKAGLIELQRVTSKSGTLVHYTLNSEVYEFLTGYTNTDVHRIIAKDHTRMLCPPDPWTNLTDGGYLSARRKAEAPLMNVRKLRKTVRAAVAKEFTAEKMPAVFAAANFLQSIPYSLHTPTRDAIVRVWRSGGNILGVPPKDGPVRPDFPYAEDWSKKEASEEELEVFNAWKRRCAAYWNEMREWRGKVREVGAFIKSVTDTTGPMWFPVYCDFRGRWYYRGVPNPQGSDLAKGVLHFHEKKPLGKKGLFWLKVHIANSYGYDKERMKARAAWTERNWEAIERALDAPEDHPEVWGTDAPWCMFSAAWELREALRSGNPEGYCTGIPIHMDATCSGLQHFSALLRDPVGGLYVNLRDPDKVGPKQDIYSRVGEATMQMLRMDAESQDPEVAAMAKWALLVGIPRELAKKPVMTYVYGATLRGTAEHVEYVLNKSVLPAKGITWPDPLHSYKYSLYIAQKLFQGIAAAVPAAAAAMEWLQNIAKQQPNGRRMQWRTPTNFLVQHDYQDYSDRRVEINACGVCMITVREWTEGTRAHSMQNAISPNFVHALDASHLTLVANSMHNANLSMVAIHDSFGTHACDVDTMHSIIRTEFVSLYSNKGILSNFLWDVGGVGEPPTLGTLDLTEILSSEFMFS